MEELRDAGKAIMWQYPNLVAVLVVSGHGVVCHFKDTPVGQPYIVTLPPVRVTVVDFIGAADAFEGAFVAQLLKGNSPSQAAVYAIHCGAHSTTKIGAQSSMPNTEELEAFMRDVSKITFSAKDNEDDASQSPETREKKITVLDVCHPTVALENEDSIQEVRKCF